MPVIIAKMEQAPSDFSQISGFYGPGAWAAWVITMIASWIPLIQGDDTHNLHFLGYALYTNWAAIDLLRHINRVPGHNDDLLAVEQARLENIVASVAVLIVGIFQAVGQMLVYFYMIPFKSTSSKCPSLARGMYLSLGTVLPLCMICSGPLSYSQLEAFETTMGVFFFPFGTTCIAGLSASVASYVLHNISSPRFGFYHHRMFGYFTYLVAYCVIVMTLCIVSIKAVTKESWEAVSRSTRPAARCYFVPCAPQRIGEWDQAFSLLVALVLFLYEFGPGMVRAVKGIQAVYITWLPAAW